MTVDSKPTTIPTQEEIATSDRSRRLRWLLGIINLFLIPVLFMLFVAIVESRQIEPVHSWIRDTPLATAGERIGRLFSRRAYRMAKGIGADKSRHAEVLIDRMASSMPTHVVLTSDKETIFGQVVERSAESITIGRLDGKISQPRTISVKETLLIKTIALPETVLTERDVDFLLGTPDELHFCLPPLLISTTEGYAQAHDLHLSLSLLEDAFRLEFAPLLEDDSTQHSLIHIVHSRLGEASAIGHSGAGDAWYDSLSKRLVVQSRSGAAEYDRLVRHEGTHELCDRLKLFGSYESAPLWLREGLAQYCETSPLGGRTASRTALLVASVGHLQDWDALLAPHSVEDLSSGTSAAAFYVQSWFLVAWLMEPPRRVLFFKWLSELDRNPQHAQSFVGIMNAVGTTASQLNREIVVFCTNQKKASP